MTVREELDILHARRKVLKEEHDRVGEQIFDLLMSDRVVIAESDQLPSGDEHQGPGVRLREPQR